MTFNLEETVSKAVQDAIGSGALEKLVQEQVSKAVTDVFEKQFGYRTPFREALDKALTTALQFDPSEFDVQRYQLLVRNMVKQKIEEKMNAELAAEMEGLLKDIFDTDVPAEIKLSELVKAYIEKKNDDYDRGGADRVNSRVETSASGYTSVSFHPNGKKSLTYSSEYEITIHSNKEGEVYHIALPGIRDPKKDLILHNFDAFERLVIGLYMRKSKLILDDYDSAYQEPPEDNCSCD